VAEPKQISRDLAVRIDAFIERCERQHLKPDAWESNWLVKAIAHVRGGNLEAAQDAISRAELPIKSRIVRSVSEMTFRPLTTGELRSLFQQFLDELPPESR